MLNTGQTIDHFKVVKKLGEGGMGEVYLAENQKLNRQVALKIRPADYFGDAERQQRFQREAKTAAQISHANVMAIKQILQRFVSGRHDPSDGDHATETSSYARHMFTCAASPSGCGSAIGGPGIGFFNTPLRRNDMSHNALV